MSSNVVEGAGAVQELLSRHFQQRDTLLTLYYGDAMVSQFMTTIDDVEAHYKTEDLDSDQADNVSDASWNSRVHSITLYGELVEAAEAHGRAYSTEVTFLVEDPGALSATVEKNQVTLWAGGDWVLILNRLHEPLRHRTPELLARGDVMRLREDDEGACED